MEILIFKDSLLYRIDGFDKQTGKVALEEIQCFYDQEAMVSEISDVGNIEFASVVEIQAALGQALAKDCPELREHREHYAVFPRIRVCIGEGADNA